MCVLGWGGGVYVCLDGEEGCMCAWMGRRGYVCAWMGRRGICVLGWGGGVYVCLDGEEGVYVLQVSRGRSEGMP